MMKKVRNIRRRAFTLVELLVCVAIIVIITSLSAPLFSKVHRKIEEENTVWNIVSLLNYARYQAVGRSVVIKASYKKDLNKIVLYKKIGNDYEELEGSILHYVMLPDSMKIIADEEILFFPDGSMDEEKELKVSGKTKDFVICVSLIRICLKDEKA